jgi:hypothetical protein
MTIKGLKGLGVGEPKEVGKVVHGYITQPEARQLHPGAKTPRMEGYFVMVHIELL